MSVRRVLRRTFEGLPACARLTQPTLHDPVEFRPHAQFLGNDLSGSVTQALSNSGLPANRLELEVTESLLLFERGDQRAMLQQLNRQIQENQSIAIAESLVRNECRTN